MSWSVPDSGSSFLSLALSVALAAFLPEDDAIYEGKVLLDKASSPSGLKWSREKAEKIEIPTGTFCNVQVITSKKKVYEVLIGNVEDKVNDMIGD